MKKSIFLIILLFALFPFFVLAQLDYPYPVIPGTTITITEESTLGDLIKYLTSWAIIIGALIAFLVLIYYGFIYLTSSFGVPERVREAKSKILNAFLGLAILIGSYVIMLLINPQFMILRLEKQPIDEGIVLLSETGYNDLKDGATIEELVMRQNAVYFFNSTDLQKYPLWGVRKAVFGKLVSTEIGLSPTDNKCRPTEVNFENFKLAHLGFLPKSQKDVKIIAYLKPNFKIEVPNAVEYLSEGKLNEDGRITIPSVEVDSLKINEIKLQDFESDLFKVKYRQTFECVNGKLQKNYTSDCKINTECAPNKDEYSEAKKPHPPLSLLRVPYGPGIYLYGDKIGEQIYFKRDGDYPKFKRGSFKAEKIEIKNTNNNDFIAVLYEKKNFDGDIKIIFESRDICLKGTTCPPDSSVVYGGYKPPDYEDLVNPRKPPPRQELNNISPSLGSIELNKVSSSYIRELSDGIEDFMRGQGSSFPDCNRVWLCTESNYRGNCLVFTHHDSRFKDKDYSDNPDVWLFSHAVINNQPRPPGLDLPFLKITDLRSGDPNVKFIFKKYSEDIATITTTTLDIENTFNDKIKSIKIEGSDTGTCMVVLYENFYMGNVNFPGKSEVFFKSDPDLKGHKIHQCRLFGGLLFWVDNPCASAIAVFPIKK